MGQVWSQIAVRDVRLEGTTADRVATGAEVTLSAEVDLAGLADEDVLVEAVLGEVADGDEIIDPQLIPLRRGDDGRFAARFALAVPGRVGCTVRVTPQHPVLSSRAELGLVTTA